MGRLMDAKDSDKKDRSIAKTNRPFRDVSGLREIMVLHEDLELSLDPKVGFLSDPSANYSSDDFIRSVLQAMQTVLVRSAVLLDIVSHLG